MSVVELKFYAWDDPNGSLLGTITDADLEMFEIMPEHRGAGAGTFSISRSKPVATSALLGFGLNSLAGPRLVKVHFPWMPAPYDTDPVFAFWLWEGDFKLLDQQGDDILTFSGPGVRGIWSEYVLYHSSTVGDQPFRGSADVDGMWWWQNQPYGAIATRIFEEGRHAPYPGAPAANSTFEHVTIDFDRVDDSDGQPWSEIAEEYEFRIRTDAGTVLADLEEAGDFTLVGRPDLSFSAYESWGTDRTGTAYGAGVVRVQGDTGTEADNILTDLSRHANLGRQRTHLLGEDKDGAYHTEVHPDYTSGPERWGSLESPETNDDGLLNRKAAQAFINQGRDQNQIEAELKPGNDESTGRYLPFVHYEPGDTITVDTGSGEHQYVNVPALLTAFRVSLADAADDMQTAASLHVVLMLNTRRVNGGVPLASPNSGSSGTSHTHPPNPRICRDTGGPFDVENGDAEDTGGGQWSGGAYQTLRHRSGSRSYGVLSSANPTLVYTFDPAQVFLEGVTYTLQMWHASFGDETGNQIKFGVAGVDEATIDDQVDLDHSTGTDGMDWSLRQISWTPTADRTGVRLSFEEFQTPAAYFMLDDVTGTTGDSCIEPVGLVSSSGDSSVPCGRCVAAGNHIHAHGNLSDDGDHHHSRHQIQDLGVAGAGGGFDVTPPHSTPLPPRVGPSGSGLITADTAGRINLDTGSGYKSFPGLAFLEGRLHLVYRKGTAHNSSGGTIEYRWSDDLGVTWSAAVTIATPPSGDDYRDPCILAMSSGRLFVGFDHADPAGGPGSTLGLFTMYSDTRGQSWTTPTLLPDTDTNHGATTCPPVEMPDGRLLLPGYVDLVGDGSYFPVIWPSTDGGESFGAYTTVAPAGAQDFNEIRLIHAASGLLHAFIRAESNGHTYHSTSADGGATWTTPTDILASLAGRPDVVELWPNVFVWFGRGASSASRWAVSWDEGVTWSALQETDAGVTLDAQYHAPFVLTPGDLINVYSIENSSSDADLYIRRYSDGYGVDSTGVAAFAALTVGGEDVTAADPDDVRDAGRWEVVVSGSPPEALYDDGDWLYAWVTT